MTIMVGPRISLLLLSTLFACATPVETFARDVSGQTARIVWLSWECAALAEYIGDAERQQAHFESGLSQGRALLETLRMPNVDPDALLEDAPVGLRLVLGGPTNDFILGRIFDAAADSAADRVTKRDLAGLPLPEGQWALDDEVQASNARFHYDRSNCSVLLP